MDELRCTPLDDLVSLTEAAEMTGRDSSVFRHRIRAGRLESVRIGWAHFIRRADVEAYIANGDVWPQPEPEVVA